MVGYAVIALVFSFLAVVFALQNTALVNISFLAWERPDTPLAVIIIIALIAGFVIATIFAMIRNVGKWQEKKKMLGEIKSLETSVAEKEKVIDGLRLENEKVRQEAEELKKEEQDREDNVPENAGENP